MGRREQSQRVDVGGAVPSRAPVQAGGRAAGMPGGERAEGGTALDRRAGRDGRRHGLVGRPQPVGVLYRDHPAVGQPAGEDDHARRSRQYRHARRGGQVDSPVARAEAVRRLLERPDHRRDRRPERPGVPRTRGRCRGRRRRSGRARPRRALRRVDRCPHPRGHGGRHPGRRRVRSGSRAGPGRRPGCRRPGCRRPGCRRPGRRPLSALRLARPHDRVPGRTPRRAERPGHDRPPEREEHGDRCRRSARPPPPAPRPRRAPYLVHVATLLWPPRPWGSARRAVDGEPYLWTTVRRVGTRPEGGGDRGV